ncbi:hypothetical protein ALTERO38_52136 [Alteromonas sp. 38]|nr:hypothetical protein ALTER154_50091 [Alteromonas sp. 154]VXC00420.1 hypothetical protein ALTERO38_52136 [Alteromonas sp. 38]
MQPQQLSLIAFDDLIKIFLKAKLQIELNYFQQSRIGHQAKQKNNKTKTVTL